MLVSVVAAGQCFCGPLAVDIQQRVEARGLQPVLLKGHYELHWHYVIFKSSSATISLQIWKSLYANLQFSCWGKLLTISLIIVGKAIWDFLMVISELLIFIVLLQSTKHVWGVPIPIFR